MGAKILRCPACGAPASLDDSNCAYCSVRLATVACPSCFGRTFVGVKFCFHCGARVVVPAARGDETRPCPRCKGQLASKELAHVIVRECEGCQGLWVDADSFQAVCEDRAKQALLSGMAKGPEVKTSASAAQVTYLPCPDCGKMMNRVNFARVSGILMDVCKAHGTWFDRDELRQTVEFIRAGGLEKARERQLEALAEERRRLAEQQAANRAEMGRFDSPREGRAIVFGDLVQALISGLLDR